MADAPLQQQPIEEKPLQEKSVGQNIARKQYPTRQEALSESLKTFVNKDKWPAWAIFLLAGFVGIPKWKDYLGFYFEALHHVGGVADMIADAFPYVGICLTAFGFTYMAGAIFQEEAQKARPWVPLAGWTLFFCAAMLVGTLVLFAVFVTSSNIPAAMHYFAEQSVDRRIVGQKEAVLKAEFTKIKDLVPPFSIRAEREIESLQYADDLLRVSKEAGLKIILHDKEQDRVQPEDLDSTSWHGIMIAVQFADAPTHPAILLKSAFDAVGLETHFLTVTDGSPNILFVVVAPR